MTSSGQPTESQFKDIANAGFEVVMNLAMPNSENAIPEEGSIVTARKMTYIHIPVVFDAPTANDLRLFIGFMEALKDKKRWVHCVVNYRVSAFLYQYFRLVHDKSTEEARAVMIPEWEPDAVWQAFMKLERSDVGL